MPQNLIKSQTCQELPIRPRTSNTGDNGPAPVERFSRNRQDLLTTLIVPATIPQEDVVRQLLIYGAQVFLYAPSEETPTTLPAEFGPLCQHYAPAPLGADLANFHQLLRDMTSHRSEHYGGGLSRLSARASAVDEESVWRLISRLSPQAATRAGLEALVQARLLLALAEVRDQEEREIAETLAMIDGQGHAMLHGLGEEDDDEAEELRLVAGLNRPQASDTLDQRLWAWSQLFLADPRMIEHWLITTTPEVMAIITDLTTTRLDETPSRILSLPLPGASTMALAPALYLEERTAWQEQAAPSLAALAGFLKSAAQAGLSGETALLKEKWLACQQAVPSWPDTAFCTLDLYLLPCSLATLFAKIAKRTAPPVDPHPLPHGLVAVLNNRV